MRFILKKKVGQEGGHEVTIFGTINLDRSNPYCLQVNLHSRQTNPSGRLYGLVAEEFKELYDGLIKLVVDRGFIARRVKEASGPARVGEEKFT